METDNDKTLFFSQEYKNTPYPRSLGSFYMASYYIMCQRFLDIQYVQYPCGTCSDTSVTYHASNIIPMTVQECIRTGWAGSTRAYPPWCPPDSPPSKHRILFEEIFWHMAHICKKNLYRGTKMAPFLSNDRPAPQCKIIPEKFEEKNNLYQIFYVECQIGCFFNHHIQTP